MGEAGCHHAGGMVQSDKKDRKKRGWAAPRRYAVWGNMIWKAADDLFHRHGAGGGAAGVRPPAGDRRLDRGAGGRRAGHPHADRPARHRGGRGHRRDDAPGDDLRGGQTVFMKKDLLLVWERVLVLCSGEGKMHVLLLGSGSQGGALFFRYRGSIGSKRPEIRIPEV